MRVRIRQWATAIAILIPGGVRADVEPLNSFLSCHPYVARADGAQACVVRATVHGADGLPVANKEITLRSSRGDVDVIEPASAQTDALGRAEFAVRSKSPGTATLTAVCAGSTIARGVVVQGAVAIYTFDGDSVEARLRDLSGNGNHAVAHGNPGFAPGRWGEALQLNGRDQYVEAPHAASLAGKHGNGVEAWVFTAPKDDDHQQVIAQKSFTHRGDYNLNLQGRRIAYHYRSSQRGAKEREQALSDFNVLASNTWTHALGFWEGSNIHERVRFHGYVRCYVSQESFDSNPKAQQVEGIWNGRVEREPLSIGRSGDDGQYFTGLIDELRIYNRALYDEELRRNHAGEASVTFGLEPPPDFAADAESLPECVILSWNNANPLATTYKIYRGVDADFPFDAEHLVIEMTHARGHFRDYDVDHGTTYFYRIATNSFGNESPASAVVTATPRMAPPDERWHRGDGHLHTYPHVAVSPDFTPEATLAEARKLGWDFVLVTEHNNLGSWFRSEDQATSDFIVFGNGQEISNGGEHRTGAFLRHFIPTSDTNAWEQNEMALAMGGEVGPNHSAYRDGAPNITLFELVNNERWFPFEAWDEQYLKQGIRVMAKGGSDAHGKNAVKRGIRWCVWADRLSHRSLRDAIRAGRTLAVDGEGLLCMLKVNGAMIGDTLRLAPGAPLDIEISADAELGNVSEVTLIRYGETVQTWQPNEARWSTRFRDGAFAGTPTYYRLEVRSDGIPRRAVTSAIFLEPADSAQQ